jgi:GNAT superfamily N-acetyltransferase
MPPGGSARPRPRRRPFQLRPARPADLDVLVAHRLEMWRDIGGRTEHSIRAHGPHYRAWARSRLRTGELEAVVAEVDGQVVGSGALWWMAEQPRPGLYAPTAPYILSMYTDPAYRGLGVATAIVKALLRAARRGGAARVSLHASPQGRGVYERLGFESTAEMRKWLRRPRGMRPAGGPVTRRARAGPRP